MAKNPQTNAPILQVGRYSLPILFMKYLDGLMVAWCIGSNVAFSKLFGTTFFEIVIFVASDRPFYATN